MKKRTIGFSVVVILLLIGGTVWAILGRNDPQVQKVRDMQKEMFVSGKPPQPEQFEKLRKEMDQLSPSQRQEVVRGGFENMQRQMNSVIDGYFASPKEKQDEYLDKQIKEMDERFKQMASARPPQGQPPPGAGQPPRAGGPGGPNMSSEARSQWRNQMLDHTTPERRAKFMAYFAAVQKRRIELGLPAFPPFPGPPRPPAK